MRFHIGAIVLTLCLALSFGCSSNSTDSSSTTAQKDAGSSAAAKGATEKKGTLEKMEEAVGMKAPVIPAGTAVTIRLGQTLSSKSSEAGQTFEGTLASAVRVDGKELIPAGSKVTGEVTDAHPLGKFKGGATLGARLTAVEVKGKSYDISTSMVARSIKGKGKRTAVVAGGGAALGAIIGGLAGGGKGAAIGALAGGGAGTAGAAYTGNKEIVFPAESALTFTLKDALELK
jgi:hypothetical protein